MSKDAKVHPDFLKFESKVDKVAKMIEQLIVSQTPEGERRSITVEQPTMDLTNFIATTDRVGKDKHDTKRLVCSESEKLSDSDDSEDSELDEFADTKNEEKKVSKNTSKFSKSSSIDSTQLNKSTPPVEEEMDKFTFMSQLEDDANKRYQQRRQREALAQQFREIGNKKFHDNEFEAAVLMYTKAIEHVKDSPILYNNRAFAYIKLKNYKRALIDCDFVLNKLDERNLRSWMYRAAASKRDLDEQNYQSSIRMAKEKNSKQHEIINEFVQKIESGDF